MVVTKKLLIFLCVSIFALANQDPEIEDLSEELGYLIGKQLEELDLPLNLERLKLGIQKSYQTPDMEHDQDTYLKALNKLQLKKEAEDLKQAENFLQTNVHENGIVSLENGKLQYRIERKGTGSVVKLYHTPLVLLKARNLNDQPLHAFKEPEPITLLEAVPGFQKGLVGMKEGEVRTLFIHPDLAFGSEGLGSLIIYEVEIIKADASLDGKQALKDLKSHARGEIALPHLDDPKSWH